MDEPDERHEHGRTCTRWLAVRGQKLRTWIRLARHISPDRVEPLNRLYDECNEIVSILVSSLKTIRRS